MDQTYYIYLYTKGCPVCKTIEKRLDTIKDIRIYKRELIDVIMSKPNPELNSMVRRLDPYILFYYDGSKLIKCIIPILKPIMQYT